MNAAARHGVLATFYVAQGVLYGFAGFVLLPTLAAQKVSLEAQTGVLALAGVPWVFKLGWAVLLDRKRGRPKRVAAGATAGLAVLIAAIASLGDPTQHVLGLGALWLALNVVLSLQDVATDALALDTIAANERGTANGIMLGSHHLGMEGIAGLALGGYVAAHNLNAGLWLLAGVLVAAAAVGAALPASGGESPKPQSTLDLAALGEILRQRTTWIVGLFAAVVLAADVLTSAVAGEFMINRLGWTQSILSHELAPRLLAANLIGFALAAAVVDRVGHRAAATVGSVALGGLWIAFGLAESGWASNGLVYGFISLQAVATALLYTGLHAWLMDRVDARVRATHFAAFTSLLNLPRALVPAAAPGILGRLGWSGLFLAAGVFQVAMAGALAASRRGPASRGGIDERER